MFDFVSKRYWYLLLSALIIIPGVISLLIPPALRPGIEFSSGTLLTLRFSQTVGQADLRTEFAHLGYADAVIQRTSDGDFLVRTRLLKEGARSTEAAGTIASEQQSIIDALQKAFGTVQVLGVDSVSPIVAAEIVSSAALAILVAAIGILLYITWAFRRVPRPFRYGTCAIIALVHDILVVVGVFSILGKIFGLEVDTMFITALLTVIGFSVHDTIVVFDRIRENLAKGIARDFEGTVNYSLVQTMGRSITTSLTVVLTLVALLLFGGITIRNFVMVLLIGIISGTYSSIFNASLMLVIWEKGELGRFLGRLLPISRQAQPRS